MDMKIPKNLTLAIVLTIIPLTDMLGVNWFYLAWPSVGIVKIVVFLLCVVVGVITSGNLLAMVPFLLVFLLWWIIDIFLISSGRIEPR